MAYCTQGDILGMIDEAELIQATDDEGLGVVNTDRVTDAIDSADAEINGYLGGKYPVPIDPAPAILKTFAVDLAIYNLLSRRIGVPEHRQARQKNAVAFLKSVAKGEVSLGVNDPDGSGDDNLPEFEGPARIFSRDSLAGF